MDPIARRLKLAEDILGEIDRKASDLRTELADIKRLSLSTESNQEKSSDVIRKVSSKTIPPPLPTPQKTAKSTPSPPQKAGPTEADQGPTPPKPVARPNLELQLGRVWFVRLGIILLTTGLVFLSRYTYDNFIRDLGPGLRLAMLYLFSGALTVAGLFCEQWKESLKSYGRIVAAGGLAAIYYCSFAAHNVENLKVIESPLFASILLTASAGLISAVSIHRESRVMMATSLGLAFYSISVNPIGWMACLSALLLSVFGIAVMMRYRWSNLGFLVLFGSYASFFWWQIATGYGTEVSIWFLPAYWLLFVAASLFATRDLNEMTHGWLTTLNHAAFFLLFSIDLQNQTFIDQQWLLALLLGTSLILLGLFADERFPRRSVLLHLAKGVGLVTLGISLKLSGYHLVFTLLIESLVLMTVHHRYPSPYTRGASWLVAALSLIPIIGLHPAETPVWLWMFGVIGWLALGILDRWNDHPEESSFILHPPAIAASLVSAAFLVGGVLEGQTTGHISLVLLGLSLVASILLGVTKIRSRAFDALWTYLALAFPASLSLFFECQDPSLLLGATFTIAAISTIHWIHQSRSSDQPHNIAFWLSSAVALIGTTAFFLSTLEHSSLPALAKLILLIALPVTGSLLSLKTRSWLHSVIPFSAYFALPFFLQWSGVSLFTAFGLSALHLLFLDRTKEIPLRTTLIPILFILSTLLLGGALFRTLDHPLIALSIVGLGVYLLADHFGRWVTLALSTLFYAVALIGSFSTMNSLDTYLVILPPLAFHLWVSVSRGVDRHLGVCIASLLLFWYQLTLDLGQANPAAIWAVAGTIILLIGLTTRSRCFRFVALGMLAFSLGHLMLIDLVKLDPLPRILSFMTLGAGLLGLGFVYNRWQDRLKQTL
ncbi:MAG: DUF2339 domain-containing protein [Akkermansiaceae bacterium]